MSGLSVTRLIAQGFETQLEQYVPVQEMEAELDFGSFILDGFPIIFDICQRLKFLNGSFFSILACS